MVTLLLALSAAFVAHSAPVLPPTPREKHAAPGITVEVPDKYTPIPVQPSERWMVLYFVGARDRKDPKAEEPELAFIRIDRHEDPDPLPDPPPITSFERYLEQRLKDWEITATREGAAREGWACAEHELARKDGIGKPSRAGWSYVLENDERTWIVLGICAAQALEKESRAWRRCAETLDLSGDTAATTAGKWTRFYERNPAFRNPETRVRVRERLVGDWQAEDTENYLVVFHTKKKSLVNHLAKRLEGIRRSYVELFPPAREITAVSTVRICQDDDEYHLYGGATGTAGYWNWRSEELVLYVFENTDNDSQSGKEDSRIVLLHEAFHQYIHYAVGELAPHSWFNEGYGDYFSGARFNDHGEVGRIQVNPWRFGRINAAVEGWSGTYVSWDKIVRMEQPEFYGPDRPLHYAQAWSMIYFLNQSPEVRKRREWARILPTYFEALKTANARERKRLTDAGQGDDREKIQEADKLVRAEAVELAFEGVDLQEIENEWRTFVLDLKGRR